MAVWASAWAWASARALACRSPRRRDFRAPIDVFTGTEMTSGGLRAVATGGRPGGRVHGVARVGGDPAIGARSWDDECRGAVVAVAGDRDGGGEGGAVEQVWSLGPKSLKVIAPPGSMPSLRCAVSYSGVPRSGGCDAVVENTGTTGVMLGGHTTTARRDRRRPSRPGDCEHRRSSWPPSGRHPRRRGERRGGVGPVTGDRTVEVKRASRCTCCRQGCRAGSDRPGGCVTAAEKRRVVDRAAERDRR